VSLLSTRKDIIKAGLGAHTHRGSKR
jgi:hypothetical protein